MDIKEFIDDMRDLSFTRFITPKWIRLMYIIGALVCGLYFLFFFFESLGMIFNGRGVQVLLGVLMLLFSPVVLLIMVIGLRIYLEIVMVIFRIEENTRGAGGKDGPTGGFPVIPGPKTMAQAMKDEHMLQELGGKEAGEGHS